MLLDADVLVLGDRHRGVGPASGDGEHALADELESSKPPAARRRCPRAHKLTRVSWTAAAGASHANAVVSSIPVT